jgi:hypothetical protein
MKRIIFYVNVIIIAACFAGGFALLLWLLTSAIMGKVSESGSSVFAALLFISLYVPLFLVLAVFMFFAACFFIYRANIQYKKRSRSFAVLQPDLTGGWKESAFSPASHFAGGLSGFGCFAPGPGMPPTNYGGPVSFERKQNYIPFPSQRKNPSHGKRPAGNKLQIALVKGGRESPGNLPKDSHGALPSGKDNAIRLFPREPADRRKG